MLGHAFPSVIHAVQRQVETGLGAGLEGELSVTVAEQFLAHVHTAEHVRFTNTGTEASMHAIAMARAYTGKNDIAKPEGSYHGWSDFLFVSAFPDPRSAGPAESPVSLPGSGGMHPAGVASTLVLPFNDIPNTEALLRRNATRLAAVIVEPVMIDIGWVPATPEYLRSLRELTRELNIMLIFDELLTGLRFEEGSAQQRYGITPDLSTFGKALGNGFIIAAVAGSAGPMASMQPNGNRSSYVGTFNSHQTSLAASSAVLEALAGGDVARQLAKRTAWLISEFDHCARKLGRAAVMVGDGGHFHWYFREHAPTNYREVWTSDAKAYEVFAQALAKSGVLCAPTYIQHHALSIAHGDKELTFLAEAMHKGLNQVAALS